MHRYRVCQMSADRTAIVLSDDRGGRHLARIIHDVPAVGTSLKGPRPALGFGLLMCARTNKTFRLIFERVDGATAAKPAAPVRGAQSRLEGASRSPFNG